MNLVHNQKLIVGRFNFHSHFYSRKNLKDYKPHQTNFYFEIHVQTDTSENGNRPLKKNIFSLSFIQRIFITTTETYRKQQPENRLKGLL